MRETIQKAIEQSREALPACQATSQEHIRVVTLIFEPGNRSSKMYLVNFCKKEDGDSFFWEMESADEQPLYQVRK